MWLITAGPTRESIDSVRFLSNASTGQMGYEIAAAAAARGHPVVLVSGPVALPAPPGVEVLDVRSAEEMLAEARAELEAQACSVVIGVAAVADFRARSPREGKPAKEEGAFALELTTNPDVLAALAGLGRARLHVGFALEVYTEDEAAAAEQRARQKLLRKGLDGIVLNELAAMEAAGTRLRWLGADGGSEELGVGPKSVLAKALVERVERELRSLGADAPASSPPSEI